MNGIPCDFPNCKRVVEHLNVEVESCDESISVTCNLYDIHNELAYRYGTACDSEDESLKTELEAEMIGQTQSK